jgi:hypothetical protein
MRRHRHTPLGVDPVHGAGKKTVHDPILPSLPPCPPACPETCLEPPCPHAAQHPNPAGKRRSGARSRPPVSVTLHAELERGCNDGKGIAWGTMGVNGNNPHKPPCHGGTGAMRQPARIYPALSLMNRYPAGFHGAAPARPHPPRSHRRREKAPWRSGHEALRRRHPAGPSMTVDDGAYHP